VEGTVILAVKSISETKRVRYLLGLCSPAERERIELEYLEDDDAFQKMLTTEDDLIDAYARGELAGDEQHRFKEGFVNRSRGRARVQFARAFAGAVSAPRSVEPKLPGTRFNIFASPLLLRTAIIATVIVFVTVFAWLIIDRRKMTNELREVRAQSAELSKRTETLQQTSNVERTRTAEIAAQLADLRSRPSHELATTGTQRPRYVPEVKNAREIKITELPVEGRRFANPSNIGGGTVRQTTKDPAEAAINTSDATLGNSFEQNRITELPINANNVVSLLTLQPDVSGLPGYVNGGRTDQSFITLDGVDAAIRIPSSMSWIRFQIVLAKAAVHEEYQVIIKLSDGRPVTSDNWIEPLTPNQTIIYTPAISTSDLPSGDYVLLLMGKQSDGSFVKVTECSFTVIKY